MGSLFINASYPKVKLAIESLCLGFKHSIIQFASSLLEEQKRPVNDIELKAISKILGVSIDWLKGNEKTTC